MKTYLVFTALIAASLLATACTSEAKATAHESPPPVPSASSKIDDGACAKICAETGSLDCGPQAACLTACAEMRESTACSGEISAFVACASARTSADWECGDNAMPVLKDSVCNAEQAAIARCLEVLAQP